MSDPHDLRAFKGPDFKPQYEGGTGKKKPARNQVRKQASPKRKQQVRDKKASACRVCPNTDGFPVHAHHIVREGAPWFGAFTESNIVGLCAQCHHDLHAGDDRVKKILRVRLTADEVEYADVKAYPGYVDDVYFPLPKVGRNELTRVGEAA
jgi:hypothetical protein